MSNPTESVESVFHVSREAVAKSMLPDEVPADIRRFFEFLKALSEDEVAGATVDATLV